MDQEQTADDDGREGAQTDPEHARAQSGKGYARVVVHGVEVALEILLELRELFLADYERAAAGRLADWEAAPESTLALVLLLDQIPRNIFRATPRCYASDAMARAVAERAMARGFDRQMAPAWRLFLYMPLHHSENLADQQRATALVASLPDRRDPEHGENRRYGLPYVDVIERFGRFPHRNAILGRESTPEELAFLAGRKPKP